MNALCIAGIAFLMASYSGVSNAQCELCVAGVQMPQPGTGAANCTALRQIATCLEPYKSSCASNATFKQILENITMTCGDSSCNFIRCFTDRGIDVTGLRSNPGGVSCEDFRAAQPCFESKRSVCEGNPLYQLAAGYIPQVEARCGKAGSQDSGTSAIRVTWILLSVALVTMAAASL